ncbi:hypothetical protein [Nocardia sp. NPDC004123]
MLFRLSETPGVIHWAGRTQGHGTGDVLGALGFSTEQIDAWREAGVVA